MLLFEDYLSIATSIVTFMQKNGLKRFNASEGASFQHCQYIGIRTQGGTGRVPETFATLDKMNSHLQEIDKQYVDNLFKEVGRRNPTYSMWGDFSWSCQFHFLIQNALLTWKYKGGTCSGFSAIVVILLILLNIPCEIIHARTVGKYNDKLFTHTFLVIGRKPDSDIRDITTWGDDFVIIDSWDRFKVTHKKLIDEAPHDNLFFLPRYKKDWSWELFLTIDKPTVIFSKHKAVDFINAEYQKILEIIPAEFRVFRPTVYSLNALKAILSISPSQPTEKSELLRLALRQGFYECYRLKIMKQSLTEIAQQELSILARIVGYGVQRLLIETYPDFFSINMLWLDYQLSDEKRDEIKKIIAVL